MSARDRAIAKAAAVERDERRRLVTGWAEAHWVPGEGYVGDCTRRFGTGSVLAFDTSAAPPALSRADLATTYRADRSKRSSSEVP
jgi:hypothetical protein